MAGYQVDFDIRELASDLIFDQLLGSSVLITGSTGLIGSVLSKALLCKNEAVEIADRIRVIALARREERALEVFSEHLNNPELLIKIGDVRSLPLIFEEIDWIIHGASITSSEDFAKAPVEVFLSEVEGTRSVLELAREKSVKGVVYLSSLEVYGRIDSSHGSVLEEDHGALDRLVSRNSYPCAKQACECLCASYAREYRVPVKIARLAQTFGAGVRFNDGRVFAEFARSVIERSDIILHTDGSSSRSYCYTTDAIAALVTIMIMGSSGSAYNVANTATYCSVREMAELVASLFPESGIKVKFDYPDDVLKFGYAAPSFIDLNCKKLEDLGWSSRVNLDEMYRRLVRHMREIRASV